MIRFSKILLYITIILLLFWLIPWGYGFIFSKPQKNPFILQYGNKRFRHFGK